MKKNRIIFVLILMVVNSGLIAQTDFRKVKWGMSKSDVKEKETSEIIKEVENRLIYNCPLSGIKGSLMYFFTPEDQLLRSKYFLSPDHLNMKFVIQDYKMFQELLTQKYGKPAHTYVVTVDKEKVQENEWPAYLLSGDLRLETTWTIERTDIILTLSKIDTKPAIQIDYVSRGFTRQDLSNKKKKLISDI